MIATRKRIHISGRTVMVDIGDDYESFMDRDVEILIFPCEEVKSTSRLTPWGAMRGTVASIADDFDTLESDAVWEACQ